MSRVLILLLVGVMMGVHPLSAVADDDSTPSGVPQSPADFPDGWDDCMKERLKIAYVSGLPWYQRVPLAPYRLVKKWQYVRCVKALLPETEQHLEEAYPVPFDPYKTLPNNSSTPQNNSTEPST